MAGCVPLVVRRAIDSLICGLLIQVGFTALHAAGRRRSTLLGSDASVSLGLDSEWTWSLVCPPAVAKSLFAETGGDRSVAAGRTSYVLGLQGPCSTVDTACASALSALHAAAYFVRGRESTCAIAESVSLKLQPMGAISSAAAGMLSTDGRSKTFDSRANGYLLLTTHYSLLTT